MNESIKLLKKEMSRVNATTWNKKDTDNFLRYHNSNMLEKDVDKCDNTRYMRAVNVLSNVC